MTFGSLLWQTLLQETSSQIYSKSPAIPSARDAFSAKQFLGAKNLCSARTFFSAKHVLSATGFLSAQICNAKQIASIKPALAQNIS